MLVSVLTALFVLWALAVAVTYALCRVAGRADHDDLERARGFVPLQLVDR
ncbi:MAG: hypothetical protein JWM71_1800 [Solirubrobacteraceae bacterium]|nr:hypothetical protein [Solirubrobacteraceae bacterium]